MSLLWVDNAEKTQIRRHAQKARIYGMQKPVKPVQQGWRRSCRPIACLTPWPDRTRSERSDLIFFELRTVPEWSGYQDGAFWRLAMCMSQYCDAVAYSLIALAKLHAGTGGIDEHIRAMRYGLHDPVHCLLLICFEGLVGGRTFKLLRHGGQMAAPECVKIVYRRLRARPCMLFLEDSVKMARRSSIPVIPAKFRDLKQARDCLEQLLQSTREPSYFEAWDTALGEQADLLRAACLVGKSLLGLEADLEALRLIGPATTSFGFDGGAIDMLAYIGLKGHDVGAMLQNRVEGDRVGAVVAGILEHGRPLQGWEAAGGLELMYEDGVKRLPFVYESDARFGPGYAEFRDGDGWWRAELEEFFFPIPRV